MRKVTGSFGERFVELFGGKVQIKDVENVFEELAEIDERNGTISQVFDASVIAGRNHLLHSVELALEGMERDRSFANSPQIELTCWVSGLRQIRKALDKAGIDEKTERVAVVILGVDAEEVEDSRGEIFDILSLDRDDSMLEVREWKLDSLKKSLEIEENQVEVSLLEDIVLERIALLNLEA